jgi:hypothetical protein
MRTGQNGSEGHFDRKGRYTPPPFYNTRMKFIRPIYLYVVDDYDDEEVSIVTLTREGGVRMRSSSSVDKEMIFIFH